MDRFPERIAYLNSLHLWHCAQPPEFDATSIKSSLPMAAEQNEERERLGQMAYFGRQNSGLWNGWKGEQQTIDRILPQATGYHPWTYIVETGIPSADLGALKAMPTEILDNIISLLDIATIDQFKAVNRRVYEAVNSHRHFGLLNREADGTLRALRAINVSYIFSVQAVFEALCVKECTRCGDFGGYMYLPALERLCWQCLETNDRYVPMREMTALRTMGLTLEVLDKLPRFQSYPGGYYVRRAKYNPRKFTYNFLQLIDREAAEQAGVALHGSKAAMDAFVASAGPATWKQHKEEIDRREEERLAKRVEKWRAARDKWKARELHKHEIWHRREAREAPVHGPRWIKDANNTGIAGPQARDGNGPCEDDTDNESISTTCPSNYLESDADDELPSGPKVSDESTDDESCNSSQEEGAAETGGWLDRTLRFHGVTRVPWLNRSAQRTEWGFHCVGCLHCRWSGGRRPSERKGLSWDVRRRREFVFPTFRKHLEEYGPIEGEYHRSVCCDTGRCRRDPSAEQIVHHELFWRG
jgi:hypothetical protein